MWDRPPPGEGCASDITGCLWCLTAVIFGGMIVALVVAWLVER